MTHTPPRIVDGQVLAVHDVLSRPLRAVPDELPHPPGCPPCDVARQAVDDIAEDYDPLGLWFDADHWEEQGRSEADRLAAVVADRIHQALAVPDPAAERARLVELMCAWVAADRIPAGRYRVVAEVEVDVHGRMVRGRCGVDGGRRLQGLELLGRLLLDPIDRG